jgi:hypothetical protein
MDTRLNTMSCEVAAAEIEAAAMGDPVSTEAATHIASCPVCAPRFALAQRIERLLQNRPVPAPPETFTTDVLARIRQERWKAEQVVDFGFNLAVVAGLALIVCGLAGLAWQLGALPILDTAASLVSQGWSTVAPRVATDTRVVMIAILLATTAVGVWWWAEEDVAW